MLAMYRYLDCLVHKLTSAKSIPESLAWACLYQAMIRGTDVAFIRDAVAPPVTSTDQHWPFQE